MMKSRSFLVYLLRMSENYCAFRSISRQHEPEHKSLRKITFEKVHRYYCSITSAFAVYVHRFKNTNQHHLVLKFAPTV